MRKTYVTAVLLFVVWCVSWPLRVLGQAPQKAIEYHTDEELPAGSMVGNVTQSAGITNFTMLQEMQFSLAEQRNSKWDLFTVDAAGILRTTETIDRDKICAQEDVCAVNLRIIVQPIKYFRVIKVTVHIDDRNDNPPAFPKQTWVVDLSETTSPDTSFSLPVAEDLDSASNGISEYRLAPKNGPFTLSVRDTAGGEVDLKLVLNRRLDRERKALYTMWVTALDRGQPQLTGAMLVKVNVLDANDHKPKFDNETYTVMLPENMPVGTTILQVRARDEDIGPNGEIYYGFTDSTAELYGSAFGINSETGELYVTGEIDYESFNLYQLTVIARDRGDNSLPAFAQVNIHVEDLNDHAPVITINTLTPSGNAQISEGSPVGMFVAHVSVSDPDGGDLRCGMDSDTFALKDLTDREYKVITKAVFDREARSEYHINLVCHDHGQPPLTSTKHISVTVTDENDHSPVFTQQRYHHTMLENNGIGQTIVRLSTTDEDLGRNAAVVFEVKGTTGQVTVDRITGIITATQVFDYEQTKKYEFLVVAVDQGDPPRTSTVTLIVDIQDENDNKPVFTETNYVFAIAENVPVDLANVKVGQVVATDADSAPYNTVVYSLEKANDNKSMDFSQKFSIDPETGMLLLKQTLDREAQATYSFSIRATNAGYPEVFSLCSVQVRVVDINDNPPTLYLHTFNFTSDGNNTVYLSQNILRGRVIATLGSSDADTGTNAAVSYTLLNISDNLFKVDTGTGEIIANADLVRTPFHVTHITIEVSDKGTPKITTTAEITIIVNQSAITTVPTFTSAQTSFWNAKSYFAIAIAGTCILIIVLAILSIVIVKKRQKVKDKRHTYNCRLEAQKSTTSLNGSPPGGAEGGGADHGKHNRSFEGDLSEPEKVTVLGVELGESCTDDGHWPKAQENPYVLDHKTPNGHARDKRDSGIELKAEVSKSSCDQESSNQRHMVPPQQHPPSYSRPSGPHTPMKEMELQVQDMLHILLRDKESPSETGSYTDSGKGPSEEGDHSHSWPECHADAAKGLTTVVEAHALALTDSHDTPHRDDDASYHPAAPQGGSTSQYGGYNQNSDEGIYVEAIPRDHVYDQDPSRRAYENRLYGSSPQQTPTLPIPSYTPPPSYHASVAAGNKRLVRFSSYNDQAPSGESGSPYGGAIPQTMSDSASWSGDRTQEDLYASVFREGASGQQRTTGGGGNHGITHGIHVIQDENPYASYALRCRPAMDDTSMYDHLGNLTYTKDTSGGESLYTSLNNQAEQTSNPKSTRRKCLNSGNDIKRPRGGGKLQRTKAERLGETSSSSTKSCNKPKVQFWDEGPIDKCVHDVVAKYIPDRTENSTCLESVDGFSDDDLTTESGSYVIDADDFLREKDAREAETMFVDYIVV